MQQKAGSEAAGSGAGGLLPGLFLCGCAQGGGIPVTLGTSLVGPCLLNQVRYSLLEKSGSEVVQRELSVQVSFKSFYGKLLKEEGEKELPQAGRML